LAGTAERKFAILRIVSGERPDMKKILIALDLKPLFTRKEGFLERMDFSVFFAATNDEVLKLHVEEHMDLIVSKLDMPGYRSEEIFNIIKSSKSPQGISLIMVCDDDAMQRERCRRCGADAVLTMPVAPTQLCSKIRQLLDVSPRQSYRVVLNASVEGKFKNRPFLCKTENVSATGMLMRTGLDLDAGDVITCSFYLPGGVKVIAVGEIVRMIEGAKGQDGFVYGVKFTKTSPEVKSAIEEFIEKDLRTRL
jgi:DNA-binding response OmpR family regulator